MTTEDEVQRLKFVNSEMRECLLGYERLEAEIILCEECWNSPNGLPTFTEDLFDEALRLQVLRNKVLRKTKEAMSGHRTNVY